MAEKASRINFEASTWIDDRFQDLMIKLGNRHTAKGMVIELWTTAQKYWFPDKKLIPKSEFQRMGLAPLLDVGMAEEREDGIYAKGSEDAFAWLFEKQEAGRKGGKKSAEVRKKKKEGSKRKQTSSTTQAKRSTTQADSSKAKQIQPSVSVSVSVSDSDSASDSGSGIPSGGSDGQAALGLGDSPPPDETNPTQQFIAAYCDAYRAARGGSWPVIDKASAGIAKTLVADLGLARAKRLVEAYVTMPVGWFATKGYDLFTFRQNLNVVQTYLDTGHVVTAAQARAEDASQVNAEVGRRYLERTGGLS